ncbi:tRNA(adenine34) deaminase NDAI_0C02300 [Naumovozyma dairenensis CBS 421]|uniref:CMP/dCMP-type deaminase domain-containing protein n=1 Tax=Naumovozyma dairenensis (strain ATCC 10597 / BCRC 20456 / CBS 421 / NBRC 0211 / NRRL Y-12639) TaxID=1071378 RepID=G0W7X9_NAUDC|nr:hypothetical protein NDAI_0C02300 [Naumovozyma dairenensis CBS 421]CCD23890.1 hypothetical protein NDAI_0C02300 [Naumovozyma dairenensis CBS 421]
MMTLDTPSSSSSSSSSLLISRKDAHIVMGYLHYERMKLAIKLARYALDHNETPVACIFIHEPTNSVIAYGLNATNHSLTGVAHAEFMGIEQIKNLVGPHHLMDFFKDVVLYVTVEPCIMCASALKQLNIKKVVFGCANERFGGNGTVLHINKDKALLNAPSLPKAESASYEAIPGILRKEAIMLLRYFYVRENKSAVTPRNKAERNLDKETFPDLIWSTYIDRETFIQEFGSAQSIHYENNSDLMSFNDDIDWSLIETPWDDIVEDLNEKCQSFNMIQRKKSKLETV